MNCKPGDLAVIVNGKGRLREQFGADMEAQIARCGQCMEDAIALGNTDLAHEFQAVMLEFIALRLPAQQALAVATASRIADDGNCYFSATGAEHGRALRGKPD